MPEATALRVLLVEDDASIRRFVALALEGEPLQLTMAESLAQARARLADGGVDVVIADLMLGDGSGMDLLEELGARPGVRRIAFSAGIDRTTRARLGAMGVTDVLSKPVSLAALHEAVSRARAAARQDGAAGGAASLGGEPDPPAAGAEAAAVERYFGGERALYLLYRQQCLAQFDADLRHGDAFVASGDAVAMRRLAHSLKSVLTMLGDEQGGACARALEERAAAADAPATAAGWRDLAARLRALRAGPNDTA